MQVMLQKYAQLLTDYCLSIKEGDRLYIRSTTLAEPLVREVYRAALSLGAIVEYDLTMRGHKHIFNACANDQALAHIPSLYQKAMSEFDAYLSIRAPFNLMEDHGINKKVAKQRSSHLKEIHQNYFQRTASGSLRRSLCQYPTLANAQMAGMSLEDYQDFVFKACYLYEENPKACWQQLGASQQIIVDLLNRKKLIRYVQGKTDIEFSVEGRTWINSDGKTNMPSGEVFSAPVEDSVQGKVFFNYPSVFAGHEVEGIELDVENGKVVHARAEKGQEILDEILKIDGADHFGEVAIGTNYQINRATKNILFDEKIGGTIHMALGQSYLQAGGKNQSSIHWDMITDMQQGSIYADGEKIYENGNFILG